MLLRDEALFLEQAVRQMRSIAERAPDIADELCKMADELEAEYRQKLYRSRPVE
jgi:type II secretory pathway component PulF